MKMKSAIPVGDLGNLATIIVVVGITIGIGSLILITMSGTDSFAPVSYQNDTKVVTNNASYSTLTQGRAIEIISAGNMTAAGTVGLANFTTIISNYSSANSSVLFTGWPGHTTNEEYWVYYTYHDETTQSDVLETANDSINTVGDWLVIIAIVIVAVVVLSLIKYL